MAQRRQALRPGNPAATLFFFALIPTIFFTLPSGVSSGVAEMLVVLGDARQAALFALLLMLLSGAMLVFWRYRRRDDTSPRRIGRRI
jgi:hypothetical protein